MAIAGTSVRSRLAESPMLRFVDLGLLGTVYAICALGVLMIYSSSRARLEARGISPLYYVERQVAAMLIGTVVMVILVAIDYRKIRDLSLAGYAFSVLSLVLVLSPLGDRSKGTQGWFSLPMGFQLQPSEFAKVFLIVGLSGFAYQFMGEFDARRLVTVLAIAAVPIMLVLLQPDLGTAMVLGVITLAIVAAAGARIRHLIVIGAIGLVAIFGIVKLGVLAEYQVDRLTSFITPDADVSGAGYNTEQSKTAIGNGGLTGRGLFEGSQTEGAFVPEQHTDFIFTAVGEELGFFGGATLLALFAILVWRIWRSAALAADGFGTLVCVGVLAMFVFQIFENIGMTMGIMPVTGIPLPFMSYGGTSIIVSFAAIGLVLNIQMRRFS
jgi:rod shape determining protein RodA